MDISELLELLKNLSSTQIILIVFAAAIWFAGFYKFKARYKQRLSKENKAIKTDIDLGDINKTEWLLILGISTFTFTLLITAVNIGN